jgi:hypothetical protein
MIKQFEYWLTTCSLLTGSLIHQANVFNLQVAIQIWLVRFYVACTVHFIVSLSQKTNKSTRLLTGIKCTFNQIHFPKHKYGLKIHHLPGNNLVHLLVFDLNLARQVILSGSRKCLLNILTTNPRKFDKCIKTYGTSNKVWCVLWLSYVRHTQKSMMCIVTATYGTPSKVWCVLWLCYVRHTQQSMMCIVTVLRTAHPTKYHSISSEDKRNSLLQSLQTGSGAQSASHTSGNDSLKGEEKWPGREADHLPPSSGEFKNEWSCISYLYFSICFRSACRDSFAFSLTISFCTGI